MRAEHPDSWVRRVGVAGIAALALTARVGESDPNATVAEAPATVTKSTPAAYALPKATLVLGGGGMGGNPFMQNPEGMQAQQLSAIVDPGGIFSRMISMSRNHNINVLCITSASLKNQMKNAEDLKSQFATLESLTGKKITLNYFAHNSAPSAQEDKALASKIAEADVIYLGGGDQENLTRYYQGSRIYAALKAKLDEPGCVIGGNSAGSMVFSSIMLNGVEPETRNPLMIRGFDFLPFIIDTHVIQRNRYERMCRAQKAHPDSKISVLGLDEETYAVIKDGIMSFHGKGHATIISPQRLHDVEAALATRHCDCAQLVKDKMQASGLHGYQMQAGDSVNLYTLGALAGMQIMPPAITEAPSTAQGRR